MLETHRLYPSDRAKCGPSNYREAAKEEYNFMDTPQPTSPPPLPKEKVLFLLFYLIINILYNFSLLRTLLQTRNIITLPTHKNYTYRSYSIGIKHL